MITCWVDDDDDDEVQMRSMRWDERQKVKSQGRKRAVAITCVLMRSHAFGPCRIHALHRRRPLKLSKFQMKSLGPVWVLALWLDCLFGARIHQFRHADPERGP